LNSVDPSYFARLLTAINDYWSMFEDSALPTSFSPLLEINVTNDIITFRNIIKPVDANLKFVKFKWHERPVMFYL